MTRSGGPAWPAVLLCVVALAGVSACEKDSAPSACAVPTAAPAGTEAPAGQAPGGGGLEVVDRGFTEIDGEVSLGALVRNASSQIAYRTTVTLRLADSQGRDPVHETSRRQLVLEIPVVRPGEQVAVASRAGLRFDLKPSGAAADVAAFDVVLDSTRWLAANNSTAFPAFTTTLQRTERNELEEGSGRLWYSVATTSCRSLPARGAYAVFFDPAGTVVGGAIEPSGGREMCETPAYDKILVASKSLPPGIDEARTLVSVYCDLAAPSGGFRPSGAPFN